MKGQKMKTITAKELENRFDNNEDISEYMDFSKVKKLSSVFEKSKKNNAHISLSFPQEFIQILDKKVKEIGINREAFIKMIVAERLGVINK